MTTPNRRRESRYVHHLPLRLMCEGKSHFGVTEDVSNGGMRVRTEAYPQLRGLVRVECQLSVRRRLVLPAMVCHASLDEGRQQPAVGLQLYAAGAEEELVWRGLIQRIRIHARVRKQGDCVDGVVPVYPSTPRELSVIEQLARTGKPLFVPTSLRAEEGDAVQLVLVHYATRSLLNLSATTLRVVNDRKRPGLFARFDRLDANGRAAMSQFIAGSRPRFSFIHAPAKAATSV